MTKIKEYYAKDEDELLDLIASEPDEEYNGGEWVVPKDRLRIKDIFKYEKIASLEIRLDCEHNVKCYLDFGDEKTIIIIEDFLINKKDNFSILKTDIPHLYSKKGKYTLKLRVESDCPQEYYKTDITYVKLNDLVLIKRIKALSESITNKVIYLFESMKKRSIIRGIDDIKFSIHVHDPNLQ